MKKKIILAVILFFSVYSFADEYVISKIKCLRMDDFSGTELTLKYDDEEDIYYFFRSTYSRAYWFDLTTFQLEQIRKTLSKAKDWVKLANENKSTISKELPDSLIRVPGTMRSGNDWYTTKYPIPLKFVFVSDFSDNASVTSIGIIGGEEESKQNQYIDIEFESVVFVKSSIDDFIDAISLETIQKAKDNHKKEKEAADLFN